MVLFLLEGHAVRALVYRRVTFVGPHGDAVQTAVIGCIGVMLAAFYLSLIHIFRTGRKTGTVHLPSDHGWTCTDWNRWLCSSR